MLAQIIWTKQRRLTYIFYKLIKEVINLVKLLEKKDNIKYHADALHKIRVGGIPWKTTTTKKDLRKCLEWAKTVFYYILGIIEPAIIKKRNVESPRLAIGYFYKWFFFIY